MLSHSQSHCGIPSGHVLLKQLHHVKSFLKHRCITLSKHCSCLSTQLCRAAMNKPRWAIPAWEVECMLDVWSGGVTLNTL